MTPEEDAALLKIGLSIHENLLVAIFMSLFFGMYLLIFPAVVVTLFRNGIDRAANRVMLTLTLVTFVSTTLFWSMYIAEYTALIKGNLTAHTNFPLADRQAEVVKEHIQKFMVILWPQLINFMIGDAIVVWRVWALYSEKKYIRIVLVVLWILTAISYTLYTGWRQHLMIKLHSGAFDPVAEKLQVICFSMSCGTNILGTVLVGYKAWEYRRMLSESTGGRGNPTIVQRCLDLLTESGVLYCALQFTFLILNALNDNKPPGSAFDIATHVSVEAAIIVGAIYPLLTILLVATSRSLTDTARLPAARPPPVSVSRTTVNDSFQVATQKSDMSNVQFGRQVQVKVRDPGPLDSFSSERDFRYEDKV